MSDTQARLKIRRGTDAEIQAAEIEAYEPLYATDTNKLYISNGPSVDKAEVCMADDARLTDTRDPNAHTHAEVDITDLGSYSVTGHTHSESDISDLGDYVADNDTRLPRTITKTATADLTADEVTNTTISNYGQGAAMTLTLPTAAANMGFLFVVSTTGNAIHIKAGQNDKLYLAGIALDDGDKASMSTPVLAATASCFTFQTGASTYDWIFEPINGGVWIDGGA